MNKKDLQINMVVCLRNRTQWRVNAYDSVGRVIERNIKGNYESIKMSLYDGDLKMKNRDKEELDITEVYKGNKDNMVMIWTEDKEINTLVQDRIKLENERDLLQRKIQEQKELLRLKSIKNNYELPSKLKDKRLLYDVSSESNTIDWFRNLVKNERMCNEEMLNQLIDFKYVVQQLNDVVYANRQGKYYLSKDGKKLLNVYTVDVK